MDTFEKIDQEIADNIHDDFYGELFVATQLNDQLAGIASDKNANAIFKYNSMSAQAKKGIAEIDQRSRESALILASMRERGNDAFERGVVEGIYKVRRSKAEANASFTGFRGDLMTQEDWGRTIANQTRQWSQENATSAIMFVAGVATLPMLVADVLALGALAGRGASIVGREIMNTSDDLGRYMYSSFKSDGFKGVVQQLAGTGVNRTTVELGRMAAKSQPVTRLEALTTNDVLNSVAIFGMRTSQQAIGAGINATRAFLANPNAQAGAVSGVTNTAVDYYLNGDKATLTVSFVGGFIGGWTGSRLTQNFVSPIKPFTSGFIGGVAGEIADQILKGEPSTKSDLIIAGITGGLATVGVNKLFKVNTTITLVPPNPTQSSGAAMAGGLVGSYTNSELSDWYKKWFQ